MTRSIQTFTGAAAIVAVALLGACGGGGSPATEEDSGRAVAFSRSAGDAGVGMWPERNFTVRTTPEWQQAWSTQQFLISQWPYPVEPQVDFARQTILGVSMGTGPNGCHSLRIERVTEFNDSIRVEYRRMTDTSGVACTQATVRLVDFVRVPATTKLVSYAAMPG